jgi:phosphatidylserine/phosphatidylglycerophosphate/cardiolipin synthase-like enzyme
VRIIFSPDDDVVDILINTITQADDQIRFMTFSFTRDDVGRALLEQASAGVDVAGIFETRASETEFSEMPRLYCAGLDVRQDGNGQTFHHKVFIIDDHTVLTGSFNISDNATTSNDENMIIITDPSLVAQYLAEYDRMANQARAVDPADVDCR